MTQKPVKMELYTNGNVLVYDEDNEQIEKIQAKLMSGARDPDTARRVTNEARSFFILQHNGWFHQISRLEMKALLGIGIADEPLAGGTLP